MRPALCRQIPDVALRANDSLARHAPAGLFVLCSCPMSDDGPQNDNREPVTHKKHIAATAEAVVGLDAVLIPAEAVVELDAVLIPLEDQLAPTFRELDMARLYRISKGENIPVSGGYSGSQKVVQLIAEHWYNERTSQKRQTRNILAMIGVALLSVLLGQTP